MKPCAVVLLFWLAGCVYSAADIRDNPVVATWTLPAPPERAAHCIARDIASDEQSVWTASVHAGFAPGSLEVFQYLSMVNLSGPNLRAIYTVVPAPDGSEISLRWTLSAESQLRKFSQYGRANCF